MSKDLSRKDWNNMCEEDTFHATCTECGWK